MTKRNEFMKKLGERQDLKEMIYEARFDAVIHAFLEDENLRTSFIEYFVEDLMRPLDEEEE